MNSARQIHSVVREKNGDGTGVGQENGDMRHGSMVSLF
jgi:hypothetical protein